MMHDEITQGLADYDEGRLSSVTLRPLISMMKNERDGLHVKLAEAEAQFCEQQQAIEILREVLMLWAKWWNGPGRFNYSHPVIPPISKTDEAIAAVRRVKS